MSKDAVRTATPEDNPRLVELERSSPQGTKLQIYSERKDYFFRSTLYGNQHTIRVATHHMAALYCRQEITTEGRDYLCDRRRYS